MLQKVLNSIWFKRIYFAISLSLLGIGLYSVFDPEPFLKFGYLGIFVFNALGGIGTFLIPTLSSQMNIWFLAFATALGIGINDSTAWLAGRGGSEAIYKMKWVPRVEKFLDTYGWKPLFVLSVLPLPYDAIGLILGYLGLDYLKFFIPMVFGKFVRVILIGYGYQWLISL